MSMSNAEAAQRLQRMAINQPGIDDRDMDALLHAAAALRRLDQITGTRVRLLAAPPPPGARLMWGRLRNHIIDPLHPDHRFSVCGVLRTDPSDPQDDLDLCRTCLRGWPRRRRFPYACPAVVDVDDTIDGDGEVACGNRLVFTTARDGFSCMPAGGHPSHRFTTCPCGKPQCTGWRPHQPPASNPSKTTKGLAP
jgi:hypothetical protein